MQKKKVENMPIDNVKDLMKEIKRNVVFSTRAWQFGTIEVLFKNEQDVKS